MDGDGDTGEPRRHLSVFVLSASMRAGSMNTALARLAAAELRRTGVAVEEVSMSDVDCPSYDGDVETAEGMPHGAQEFRRLLDTSNGFVICSPEYNASVPGVLKNAIDWTSRFRPQPFHERHCLLLSASPSMVGGNRGLWSLRVPLEHLGVRVYPEMFSLARAHEALADDGTIGSDTLRSRFRTLVEDWSDLVEASTHYPCAKAHWVEFLGEDLEFDPAERALPVDR